MTCPTSLLTDWRDYKCQRAENHPGWHYGEAPDGAVLHWRLDLDSGLEIHGEEQEPTK